MTVTPTHWALLAAARFFLAWIVFNAHYGIALPAEGALKHPIYFLGRQLGPLAAILGFLMISGFSIAHSVELPIGFYRRRLGRIYPVLCVAVLSYASLVWLLGPITTTSGAIHGFSGLMDPVLTLLFLNGILVGSFLGPTWSLAVEALFYLAAPLLRRVSSLVIGAGIAVSACAFVGHDALGIPPLPGAMHGKAALAVFWAWGAGFLAYRHGGQAPIWTAVILAIGSILVLRQWNYEGGRLIAITLSIAALAVSFDDRFVLGDGARSVLNYLGDLSYPMFLLHYPVLVLLSGVLGFSGNSHVLSYAMITAVVLLVSVACLHCVDRPGRRWIAGHKDGLATGAAGERADRQAPVR